MKTPSVSLFSERRLLFFAEAAPAHPEGEEVQNMLKNINRQFQPEKLTQPEVLAAMQAMKMAAVNDDLNQLKTGYQGAIESFAKAVFAHEKASSASPADLAKIATGIEKKLRDAQAPVRLSVAGGELVIQHEEIRTLDPVMKTLIEDNLRGCPPDLLDAVKDVAKETGPADGVQEAFMSFASSVMAFSPAERPTAIMTLAGRKNLNSIQDAGLKERVRKFTETVRNDPAQQVLLKKVQDRYAAIVGTENAEKRKEADGKIPAHAAQLCAEFDKKTNHTPAEKSMMVAKLMMAGVDTSNEETIFNTSLSKEQRFPPVQGTDFDRMLNRAMGAFTFLAQIYEQVRGTVQAPAEKRKAAEAAKAQETARSTVDPKVSEQKEILRKKMIEDGKTAGGMLADKETARTAKQAEVTAKKAEAASQRAKAEDPAATRAAKAAADAAGIEADKAQKELKVIVDEIDQLKAMKTEAEKNTTDITNGINGLKTLLETPDVMKLPKATELKACLENISCERVDVGLILKLKNPTGGLLQVQELVNAISKYLPKDVLPSAVLNLDATGEIKSDPSSLAKALVELQKILRAEGEKK